MALSRSEVSESEEVDFSYEFITPDHFLHFPQQRPDFFFPEKNSQATMTISKKRKVRLESLALALRKQEAAETSGRGRASSIKLDRRLLPPPSAAALPFLPLQSPRLPFAQNDNASFIRRHWSLRAISGPALTREEGPCTPARRAGNEAETDRARISFVHSLFFFCSPK